MASKRIPMAWNVFLRVELLIPVDKMWSQSNRFCIEISNAFWATEWQCFIKKYYKLKIICTSSLKSNNMKNAYLFISFTLSHFFTYLYIYIFIETNIPVLTWPPTACRLPLTAHGRGWGLHAWAFVAPKDLFWGGLRSQTGSGFCFGDLVMVKFVF